MQPYQSHNSNRNIPVAEPWFFVACSMAMTQCIAIRQSIGHLIVLPFQGVLASLISLSLGGAALCPGLFCLGLSGLNPIRAAIAEALEQSDYASIQRRIQALKEGLEAELLGGGEPCSNASQAMVSSLVANAMHLYIKFERDCFAVQMGGVDKNRWHSLST